MTPINYELINLNCDVRAEIIAADLIERGTAPEKIAIRPMGTFSRNFRKDIAAIKNILNHANGEEYLRIDVSRDGIYDSLPQGLFHAVERKNKKPTLADTIEEIKKVKQEEEDIRQFFWAIEKEVNITKALIEIEERKSIFGLSDNFQSQLFLDIWPEIQEINARYYPFLFQILPLAHRFRANIEMSELLLSYVVNHPVSIIVNNMPTYHTHPNINSTLDSNYLGINYVLGDSTPDYDILYHITIGPVKKKEVPKFVNDGESIKVIHFLLDYFLPFDSQNKIKIILDKSEESLYLSDTNSSSHLGFDSSI